MTLPYLRPGAVPGHRVRRAWPTGTDDDAAVLLELDGPDGRVVAGDWRPGGRVRLHRDDDRLPGLAPLVAAGARVIGHRWGRRAVLHHRGRFVKVLRPARLDAAVTRHRAVAALLPGGPEAPVVAPIVAVDRVLGTVTFAALPGQAVLTRPGPVADPVRRAVAAALGALASVPAAPDGDLPVHRAADEQAVLARWVALADRFDAVPPAQQAAHRRLVDHAADRLAALPPAADRLVHRDLHDGQLLVASGPNPVGLLDLDTAGRGDAALDVGNLLAHLRLVRADAGPLVDATRPGAESAAGWTTRVEAYAAATRARLVAVHAFRPAGAAVANALLDDPARSWPEPAP